MICWLFILARSLWLIPFSFSYSIFSGSLSSRYKRACCCLLLLLQVLSVSCIVRFSSNRPGDRSFFVPESALISPLLMISLLPLFLIPESIWETTRFDYLWSSSLLLLQAGVLLITIRSPVSCGFSWPVAAFPLLLPIISLQFPCSFKLVWWILVCLPDFALILSLLTFSLLLPVPKNVVGLPLSCGIFLFPFLAIRISDYAGRLT